ncbi:MAG TPA: outer membrane protein transport protein [Bacteroidota bacterium]|nr:outer membrane protein transport protein [Bacteroidota bacterium]
MRTMTRHLAACTVALLGAGLLAVAPMEAQTNTENFAQFRFNFNNPGARATGIGGAFMSIADDATASEANPAGLTTLLKPELSLEAKGIQFITHVDNFSSTGGPSQFTLNAKDFKSAVVSPSFVSIVYPRRRFTFALFRHELMNFESDYYTEGSLVPGFTDGTYFFPAKSSTRIHVDNYGGSVAYKFRESFSIGLSGGVSLMSMQSTISRYFVAVFNDGSLANTAAIDDHATDFFLNAGVIVKPVDNLTIGLTYKRRPSFQLHQTYTFTNYPNDSTRANTINFNVPSSYGIGISYRPTDVFTLAVDVVRVNYSSLTKNFVVTLTPQDIQPSDFTVDDGMEYHGGAEYVVFINTVGIVFRGGAYLEPDNRIRFTGNPNGVFNRRIGQALFQAGKSYGHGTFGLGCILSNNLQLDVAADMSSVSNTAVGSLVIRF